jgi:hypothetical protein
MRLSNNQIMGYVLISADKPQLRDQSNREGLIEGQLDDLRTGQDAGRAQKTLYHTPHVRRYSKPLQPEGCSLASTSRPFVT